MRRREPPSLIVIFPLEGKAIVHFDAVTHEDEIRLREWLRSGRVLAELPDALRDLLDDLDGFNRGEAA